MNKKMISEMCQELNIKYTIFSKDWITKLEKNGKIRYLSGNKFDLNGHGVGLVMDDKYAFYEVLNNIGVKACVHQIIYRENNKYEYAKGCHTKEDLLDFFNKFNKDVVVKPNLGALGIDVYHIQDEKELMNKSKELLEENFSFSICPYYEIKYEYRLIVLDNKIKLIYKKIHPVVTGDGKSTIKELLIDFNKYFFENKDLPEDILKKGETYTYEWRFNLHQGSIASLDIDDKLKEQLSVIALKVTKGLGITFASVDIIELYNGELMVLEANSGVTIDKAIDFIPNGYNIAKEIYKEAIVKMFED